MDDELEAGHGEGAQLTALVSILKPLRQQRQASAQNRERDLQAQLGRLQHQLDDELTGLDRERQQQREARENLSQVNSQRTMDRRAIDSWHADERRMLDVLNDLQQQLTQTRDQLQQLKADLQTARLETQQRQRAVEKLGCLAELLEHLS